MADPQKTPVIRGAQNAMRQFRYEVSRELGIPQTHDQKMPRRLPIHALVGEMSKRMIELADRHRRQNDGP